mmetsp:Transcript_60999/g.111769  ORF Transcript_60999/g.111769 Transcript_60999/m.111769 type:complete len:470 (+) Transcript_60999:38-1447(+)
MLSPRMMQCDGRASNLSEKAAKTARRRSCLGPMSENRSENVRPRRSSVGDKSSCEQLPRPWSKMLRAQTLAAGATSMTNLAASPSPGSIRLYPGPQPAGAAPAEDAPNARLQREMKNPRVVLLDCAVECRKAESQTSPEPVKDDDWEKVFCQEEEEIQKICAEIIKVKPDLVITEMGVSDLAQHFLLKANVSVIGHVDKKDSNRIARITGATICHTTGELAESMVGTKCGAFSGKKIGDEYFAYFTAEDSNFKVVLRGSSKDLCDSVMDSTFSAVHDNNSDNILKPKSLQSNSKELAAAPQLQEKDQHACPKEAAATMQLREEQIRLREANLALKEMQLANRQELESVERARQSAAEEVSQLQQQRLELQQQCKAEEARLEAYKQQQAMLCDKLKCCRAVVARTVGCIDRIYEQKGKDTRQHNPSCPELLEPRVLEESLVAEVEAVDEEAARMLQSLEDDGVMHLGDDH